MASSTLSTPVLPKNRRKYIGSVAKLSAMASNSSGVHEYLQVKAATPFRGAVSSGTCLCTHSERSASCVIMRRNSRTFLISKEPHNVRTPRVHKSSDSWLSRVVLPAPVVPVMMDISPRR